MKNEKKIMKIKWSKGCKIMRTIMVDVLPVINYGWGKEVVNIFQPNCLKSLVLK